MCYTPREKLSVLVVENAGTARQHPLQVLEDAEHRLRRSSGHQRQQRRFRALVNLARKRQSKQKRAHHRRRPWWVLHCCRLCRVWSTNHRLTVQVNVVIFSSIYTRYAHSVYGVYEVYTFSYINEVIHIIHSGACCYPSAVPLRARDVNAAIRRIIKAKGRLVGTRIYRGACCDTRRPRQRLLGASYLQLAVRGHPGHDHSSTVVTDTHTQQYQR